MLKTNLLHSINLPYTEILSRVNWALEKSKELHIKYSKNIRVDNTGKSSDMGTSIPCINNTQVYNVFGYQHPVESIIIITESFNCLNVRGTYITDTRIETYDIPLNSKDEGWRTIKGNFINESQIEVPIYLFDLPLDEVFIKMNKEYSDKLYKNCIDSMIQIENILKRYEGMLSIINDIKIDISK